MDPKKKIFKPIDLKSGISNPLILNSKCKFEYSNTILMISNPEATIAVNKAESPCTPTKAA